MPVLPAAALIFVIGRKNNTKLGSSTIKRVIFSSHSGTHDLNKKIFFGIFSSVLLLLKHLRSFLLLTNLFYLLARLHVFLQAHVEQFLHNFLLNYRVAIMKN